MTSKLETVPASSSVAAVYDVLTRGLVALVTDGDTFVGLITRSDLLCPFAPQAVALTTMKHRFGTEAIHAGQTPDPATGAIMTPIYATSTYVQESPGVHKGFEYSRSQNPTRFAYERCIAELEGGKARFCFRIRFGRDVHHARTVELGRSCHCQR